MIESNISTGIKCSNKLMLDNSGVQGTKSENKYSKLCLCMM